MIGLKKFKEWLSFKAGEVDDMLFPTLVNQGMLPTNTYTLKNGQQVHVSIATLDDLDAIIDIQEACYKGQAPWGRIAVNNELRNKRNAFFLMVHHESRPIAFMGMSQRQHSMHITNIATIPAYQGYGIASFLIYTGVELAKQINRNQITLEVRMSNQNAKRIYRYLGFKDGYIKRNYYHNNGEDALEMTYFIDEMEADANDTKSAE